MPYLAVPVLDYLVKQLGVDGKADAKDAKVAAIDSYSALLTRIIRDDKAVSIAVLNHLQSVVPKGVILAVWKRLHESKAIPSEGFLSWQAERTDPKKKLTPAEKQQQQFKQTAIIATSSWLEAVAEEVRKANEPEDDGEGEGDEFEDGDGVGGDDLDADAQDD